MSFIKLTNERGEQVLVSIANVQSITETTGRQRGGPRNRPDNGPVEDAGTLSAIEFVNGRRPLVVIETLDEIAALTP